MNNRTTATTVNSSSASLLFATWRQLSITRRSQLALLLFLMISSGLAELVTLGAIFPFLAAVNEPQVIFANPTLVPILRFLDIATVDQLVLAACIAFILSSSTSAFIRISNVWLNGRLAAAIGSDFTCEAYRRTLYQPYETHLTTSSSKVINTASTQTAGTVQAILAFLQLVTSSIVVLGLLAGLLLINAPIALAAFSIFGSSYLLIAFTARNKLRQNSRRIAVLSQLQIKSLQEGLGSIRDVLLDGSQSIHVNNYTRAVRPQRRLLAENQFTAAYPRYAAESVGIVLITILATYLKLSDHNSNDLFPVLGSLALGAQRLLPSIQQIYANWSRIKAYSADLNDVLARVNLSVDASPAHLKPIKLSQQITLSNVSFSYSNDKQAVLNALTLDVYAGEIVGIIGKTGCGKSTTMDILMGLLKPTSGKFLIDGINTHDPNEPERLLSWRASIAHVPQSIFLTDSSVLENIAFGIPNHLINMDKISRVLEVAQLTSTINSLPHGLYTQIGEAGIRLSGGQRQRIGIARALYKNAQVLFLDEATSALDSDTEEKVIEAITTSIPSPTIIMITHRLSTLSRCDRVFRLNNGSLVGNASSYELGI